MILSVAAQAVTVQQTGAKHLYLDGSTDYIAMQPYSYVSYDPEQTLSIERLIGSTARFQPVTQANQLHLGYYPGTLWLKSQITNTTTDSLRKVLWFEYANLDSVQVYLVNQDGDVIQRWHSGVHVASEQRPLPNRHPSFLLTLEPLQSVTLYSQVQSNGSVTAFHKLLSEERFNEADSVELFWLSVYCGMLLALGCYNLLLFAVLREPTFGFYSLFVSSFLLGTLSMNGIGPQLFWNHEWLDVNRVMAFSFSAAGFTATLFVRALLNLKATSQLWYWLTLIPMVVSGSGILSSFLLSPQTALQVADVNGLVAGIVLLSCGIYCLFRKVPGAKLFVIAWTLLLSGATLHALRNLGILPTHFLTIYGMQIGSAVEMVLLSFAIAFRFNQLKRDKERIQEEMLTSLRTHEEQLEQKVEQRTYELEEMAKHDALTGLLNRNGLYQAFQAILKRCQRQRCNITLFTLNIDHFKHINDHHGHKAGDHILNTVADRIHSCMRGNEVAARFGGDKFVILSENLTEQQDIQNFRERLQKVITQPVELNQQRITVTATINGFSTSQVDPINQVFQKIDDIVYSANRCSSTSQPRKGNPQ